jgi:hypothetical protein
MTIAIGFWGTLGAITALFFAACLTITPAGCRNRPPWWRRWRKKSRAMLWSESRHNALRPSLWQRWRDRRQHERAVNALTVRLFHDIGEGLRREATGPLTSSGMPAWESLNAEQAHARGWDEDGPLMPLPPEWTQDAGLVLLPPKPDDLPSRPCAHCPYMAFYAGTNPHGEALYFCTKCGGWTLASDPAEPEDPHDVATPADEADALVGDLDTAEMWVKYPHLRAGQYAEATGQFSRAVLDDYERSMAGGA